MPHVLVLLHAFPLTSAMWDDVRPALPTTTRVVTPDQRGFGASPLGGDPPSLDTVADDVAALLDSLGVRRAVVGGLSMGGYVAMAFCRRYGDRVAGLVLADTKAAADPEPAAANRLRIAERVLGEEGSGVLLHTVFPLLLGATTERERPAVVDQVRTMVAAAPPAGVAWAQRAMAARPDSFDTLRRVAVPALVIAGAEDRLSTVEDARAMAEALPDARLVTIPAAGHLSAVEQPAAFAAAVTDFLAELAAD
ncbi:MAG TPA: alpha/beta fold hydrolase [Mycobacteriales bacterium]|nr:alpha/beta fold hydrolase [Mycobacteriales bacterium]